VPENILFEPKVIILANKKNAIIMK